MSVSIFLFTVSFLSINFISDNFYNGIHYAVPQTQPSAARYAIGPQGKIKTEEGFNPHFQGTLIGMTYLSRQVGDDLVVCDFSFAESLEVYSGMEAPRVVTLSYPVVDPLMITKNADYWYLGSFEGDDMVIRAYSHTGDLKQEKRLHVNQEQLLYSTRSLYATWSKDQLYVWTIRDYKIRVFDSDLNLKRTISPDFPDYLSQYDQMLIMNWLALKNKRQAEDFEAFSMEHQGEVFAVRESAICAKENKVFVLFCVSGVGPSKNLEFRPLAWSEIYEINPDSGAISSFCKLDRFIIGGLHNTSWIGLLHQPGKIYQPKTCEP